MDAIEQAAGEKRVMSHLIVPLQRRGLARPSTLRQAQFEAMVDDLCKMLAYMSGINLQALAEVVAANPGGKGADRFPIANKILEWARQIQAPEEDASPLQRAVFAAPVGRAALDGLWAPELLALIKAERKWPGRWSVSQIKAQADDAVRRLRDVEMRLSRGDQLNQEDLQWRDRRRAAIQHCQDIAVMAQSGVQV